jgi:hypothetical protein
MSLLAPELHAVLRANARAGHDAMQAEAREPDPAPVVKFFNPVGAATWLATELDADGNTLFGLADLGFGCPELRRPVHRARPVFYERRSVVGLHGDGPRARVDQRRRNHPKPHN